jgi:hypothetical protein
MKAEVHAPVTVTLEREPQVLDLTGGASLVVTRNQGLSNIELFDQSGRLTLSLLMTPEGPVLKLGGAGLRLDVEGELSLAADRVKIAGREGVEITSGGDVVTNAVGRSHQNARSHEMISDLGDIHLKANDDVRLNGERVMVNCVPDGTP